VRMKNTVKGGSGLLVTINWFVNSDRK